MPTHKAARQQEPGRTQCILARQQARSEADAAGKLIWLARQGRTDFDGGIANREPCTRFDLEACHQRRVGDSAENAIVLRQRIGERAGRIEDRSAE